MKRRLLNLLTALSLLLCLATCALWARTYVASDWLKHAGVGAGMTERTEWGADTAKGTVRFTWKSTRMPQAGRWLGRTRGWAFQTHEAYDPSFAPSGAKLPNRLGFNWAAEKYAGIDGSAIHRRSVRFPLWVPAAALASLPAARLYLRLRRAPREPAACACCGYDLRATPGRCPECGTAARTICP